MPTINYTPLITEDLCVTVYPGESDCLADLSDSAILLLYGFVLFGFVWILFYWGVGAAKQLYKWVGNF